MTERTAGIWQTAALCLVLTACRVAGHGLAQPHDPPHSLASTQQSLAGVHREDGTRPFHLTDNELTNATVALVAALNDGDTGAVISLMATEHGFFEGGFNDCDYTTNNYFKTNQVSELLDRIAWIHRQGHTFILDGVVIGSGANPEGDPASIVGADVRRFGPGLDDDGLDVGIKLRIHELTDGRGLFTGFPLTSATICANPGLREQVRGS